MEPLLTIEEQARMKIYQIVGAIDAKMRSTVESQQGEDVMYRELDIVRLSFCPPRWLGADGLQGSYQLETLLESHLDKAFDRFTAWTLRNAFDVPDDADIIMASHPLVPDWHIS